MRVTKFNLPSMFCYFFLQQIIRIVLFSSDNHNQCIDRYFFYFTVSYVHI